MNKYAKFANANFTQPVQQEQQLGLPPLSLRFSTTKNAVDSATKGVPKLSWERILRTRTFFCAGARFLNRGFDRKASLHFVMLNSRAFVLALVSFQHLLFPQNLCIRQNRVDSFRRFCLVNLSASHKIIDFLDFLFLEPHFFCKRSNFFFRNEFPQKRNS